MQKSEREGGQNPSEKATLTTLERIFGVQTPAKVIAFDPSRRFGLDRLPDASELAHPYSSIFGRRGEIAKGYPEVEDFGEKRDSFRMQFIRQDEAEYMADFLFKPSLSPEQIRQRQEVLERLIASEDLDKLLALKNRAYRILEGIGDFQVQSGNETNQETYAGLYHGGAKKVKVYTDDFGSEVDHEEDLFPYVFSCVDKVDQGLQSLGALWGAISLQDEPVRGTFSEILDSIGNIRTILAPYVPFDKKTEVEVPEWGKKTLRYGEFYADELRSLETEEIAPRLFKIGTVLEFARKIRDDGWTKVTFDEAKPFGYKGGWNLERRKDKQVQNDSPQETPVVILSGANTSGKSFMMRSDFLIRLCAQSLGFAPVKEANFPVHKSFVYIDRASTDSENNLSAFMREVENWKIALSATGPNTRWYVDEGYSTTSPKDQAALLFATAAHIGKGKGSVVLATHNDNVIEQAVRDGKSGVYHLRTEVGENGELIRYFELKPGPMESLSIAVARARKFPSKVLEWAVSYFNREFKKPKVSDASNFPKIESFTPEQRENAKLLSKTLDHMFPDKATGALFSLFSLDREFTIYLLNGLVRGKDFMQRSVECALPHEFTDIMDLLDRMIMLNREPNSADLLERQKLFRGLSEDDIAQSVQADIEKVGLLEEVLSLIARNAVDINKGLNVFKGESWSIGDGRTPRKWVIDAAIAFLNIQKKLLGDDFKFDELLEDFRRLSQIKKLTGDDVALFNKDIKVLETINDLLPPIHLKDINIDDIQEELKVLEFAMRRVEPSEKDTRKVSGWAWTLTETLDLFGGGLPYALQRMQGDIKAFDELVAHLRSTDSVYLNQAANYLESEINRYRAVLKGEEIEISDEARNVLPDNEKLSRFNHLREYGSYYFGLVEGMRNKKDTPFKKTLKHLDALCVFAQIISKAGLNPVEFNETGEVRFVNSFSIFRNKKDQVKNDISLDPKDQRIQLLTGPNGSGKTFYEKGTIAAMLMALSTGFTPAQSATMPIFDSVVYLDRVIEKQDKKLSAFSQEIEYWKELLSLTRKKKSVFAVVDEAFSSTSPTYQAAFTYAIIAEFLQSNHFLMLSTHNHEVVDQLKAQETASVRPYHFKFSIKDGEIKYDYVVQEGHEQSHALEVARTMGLPEDVVYEAS